MNKKQKEIQQVFLDNEKDVLKKIQSNYKDALAEIDDKIALLLGRQDAEMQHVIYQVEYQKALKTQVQGILDQLQANEFTTVSDYLAKSYEDGFIGTMYDLQGQGIPLVFPIDQEQVVAAIQNETKLSEGLYSSLGKDIKTLNKQIAGEISRGISNGAMYDEIARNISNFARIPQNRAMTIARTEAHRIQEKATSDAHNKAAEKGADIVKIWSAALDGSTRDTHRELDGQIRELDEPFEVDGKTAMFPGDFGDPAEDCNCRCRCNSKARWLLDQPYTKWSSDAPLLVSDDGTTQYVSLSDAKTYKEFKGYYKDVNDQLTMNFTIENSSENSTIYINKKINSYIENPETLGITTPKEKYYDFIKHGAEVKALSKGSLKNVSFKSGGGFKVNGTKDGQYFQFHPSENSHHKGAYYKISSGKTGTKRYDMNGKLIED